VAIGLLFLEEKCFVANPVLAIGERNKRRIIIDSLQRLFTKVIIYGRGKT